MAPIRQLLWPGFGFGFVLVAVLALRWALMAVLRRWLQNNVVVPNKKVSGSIITTTTCRNPDSRS